MSSVRLGFIGSGGMARHHGRVINQSVPDIAISALTDPAAANLDRFVGEIFKDQEPPPTFADHRVMLDTVDLDAVFIISPHAYHFQQAMDALEAGCHVLIEKPMVIRTEDAQTLIAEAKKRGKVLSVAFPGPFTCEFQYIRKLIADGALGEISLINGVCAQPWLSVVAGTWRTNLALAGGGNLYDSGAHMFNAMLYLTGLSVEEVFAFTNNKGEQVDISGSVAIKFTGGVLGSAVASGDAAVFEQGIYIQGTKGAVKCSIYGGEMEVWVGKERVKYPQVPETPSILQNFVDCIAGRAETPSPPLLGLRQARLMDAIYESARTGAAVKVVADTYTPNG